MEMGGVERPLLQDVDAEARGEEVARRVKRC